MTPLLLCLALAAPAPLLAQARPDPSALDEAQRQELGDLFSRAQTAYQGKNYLEAIEALQAAYGIFPEPNILYRIGEAYEQLGDLGRAAEYYTKYVDAAPDATDAGLVRRRVTDLERRAAELEAQLQPQEPERAALLLDTNPAGAVVSLDGEQVEQVTPVRVELKPGTHKVELLREGHEPVVREIRINPGETISLVYQLERIVEPPPPPSPSPAPWALVGIGGVGLATGGGLFVASVLAGNKIDTWDAEREAQYDAGEPVSPRPTNYDNTVTKQALFRTTGIIVGGVGVAALATGIIWLATRGGGESTAVRVTADGFAFDF